MGRRRKHLGGNPAITREFFSARAGCCNCPQPCKHKEVKATTSRNSLPPGVSTQTIPDFIKALDAVDEDLAKPLEHAEMKEYQLIVETLRYAIGKTEIGAARAQTYDLSGLNQMKADYEALVTAGHRIVKSHKDLGIIIHKDLKNRRKKKHFTPLDQMVEIEEVWHLSYLRLMTLRLFVCHLRMFSVEKRWAIPQDNLESMKSDTQTIIYPGVVTGLKESWPLLELFSDSNHVITLKRLLDTSVRNKKEHGGKAHDEDHSKKRDEKSIPTERLLSQFSRELQTTIESVRLVNSSVTPNRPTTLHETSDQVPYMLPENQPTDISQTYANILLLQQEIEQVQIAILSHVHFVKEGIARWWDAGDESWKYAKDHVHDMPMCREYEHCRMSLLALTYVAIREERALAKYIGIRSTELYGMSQQEHEYTGDRREEDEIDGIWVPFKEYIGEHLLSIDEMIDQKTAAETVKEAYWIEQAAQAEAFAAAKVAQAMGKEIQEESAKSKGKGKGEAKGKGKGKGKGKPKTS